MKHLSMNEFAERIGRQTIKDKAEATYKPDIGKKLKNGECTKMIARSYGVLEDSEHPRGHVHYCIEVNFHAVPKEVYEHLQGAETRLNERMQAQIKDLKERFGVALEAELHPVNLEIQEVIVFDDCEEFDRYRNKKELSCVLRQSPN